MKVRRVDHVAIALHDLSVARGVLEDLFELPLTSEAAFEEVEAKLALFAVGETQIELLQGTDATPLVGDWLRKKGDGIFHICLEVDDIHAALAELKAKGVELIDEEPRESRGHLIAFIDPSSTANILFELTEISHSPQATT